jgi:hypothetical protein
MKLFSRSFYDVLLLKNEYRLLIVFVIQLRQER